MKNRINKNGRETVASKSATNRGERRAPSAAAEYDPVLRSEYYLRLEVGKPPTAQVREDFEIKRFRVTRTTKATLRRMAKDEGVPMRDIVTRALIDAWGSKRKTAKFHAHMRRVLQKDPAALRKGPFPATIEARIGKAVVA
jgi:hypothetical protein